MYRCIALHCLVLVIYDTVLLDRYDSLVHIYKYTHGCALEIWAHKKKNSIDQDTCESEDPPNHMFTTNSEGSPKW